MFEHQGIWLPDGEKHFPDWMDRNGELVDGRGTYQIRKFREAMKWCRQFRVAIDVGAHVGLWSMQMVKVFDRIEAFEPVPQFRACFHENLHLSASDDGCGDGKVNLHPCALGAYPGHVVMQIDPADSGGTHAREAGSGPLVELKMLDEFRFADVDFIKIDCEGYELNVLMGGLNTIVESRPCIIVEQKPHKLQANYGVKGAPAVDYLLNLGARVRAEISGDYILSWP